MSDALAQNPYAVPASNLQEHTYSQVPSVEEALSRGYDFSIGSLIGEAWSLTKGTKGIILGGFLVMYAAIMALVLVLMAVMAVVGVAGALSFIDGDGGNPAALVGMMLGFLIAYLAMMVLSIAISYPFIAAILMVGVRRAGGQPVEFAEIFAHFGRTLPIIGTALLMTLTTGIGYALFFFPGLYLNIAYVLAIPLVVERGLSPWQAMEASRKAISQHWFKVFGLLLVLGVLMFIAALLFGIGLIWVVPLMVVSIGVLYRTVFGVLPKPVR